MINVFMLIHMQNIRMSKWMNEWIPLSQPSEGFRARSHFSKKIPPGDNSHSSYMEAEADKTDC